MSRFMVFLQYLFCYVSCFILIEMVRRQNLKQQKRLAAWILTNAYGRHNTKWYAKEVNQLCVYATMLLKQPQELMGLIMVNRNNNDNEKLENRTLKYVDNCIQDLVDRDSELWEWQFEYSAEFNAAFERRCFTSRPLFFAENRITNEIIAYGI